MDAETEIALVALSGGVLGVVFVVVMNIVVSLSLGMDPWDMFRRERDTKG